MRTKVTLCESYNFSMKTSANNHEMLILIEFWKETKQWHKEYEKYQFYTQSREVFYKKTFL